ncbi:MAG TPA: DEAD/DEAH box helicase [Atribacteraceae bacterium]|nr:DEAD/DEAH box helicase [Atribacteraceae bacterium]
MEQKNDSGFTQYSLRRELLKAIADKGFTEPTPVQTEVLGHESITGDLIVRAKTGSGKTLAFLLPLLSDERMTTKTPGVLIVSPTRELALQISREAIWLSGNLDCTCASLVGGMDMARQIIDLRRGASLVVGTPGRILDHIRRGTLRTDTIHTVVLDEGDHMLDMGFREELEGILDASRQREKTWIFSATMPDSIQTLIRQYLSDPETISLVKEGEQHSEIAHTVYTVPRNRRLEGLTNVLLWENSGRGLVFCQTRAETMEVTNHLIDERFRATCLHGEMSQRERNQALSQFTSGKVTYLVATNVAARGLDVPGVEHVFQLGLPSDTETFIHRSGRTGRAGQTGHNILILNQFEAEKLRFMLRGTRIRITWLPVPDSSVIRDKQRSRFEEKILTQNPDQIQETRAWATDLIARTDILDLVTGLLNLSGNSFKNGYNLKMELEHEIDQRKSHSRNGHKLSTPERSHHRRSKGTLVRLAVTDPTEWNTGRVLRAVCTSLGVDSQDVAEIILKPSSVLVGLLPTAYEKYRLNPEKLSQANLLSQDQEPHRRKQKPRETSRSRPVRV